MRSEPTLSYSGVSKDYPMRRGLLCSLTFERIIESVLLDRSDERDAGKL